MTEKENQGPTGRLFVISAPSGAGKTTLVGEVLKQFTQLSYSISHTTRQPREGESHGKDYFFTRVDQFQAMVEANEMLEWAKVHDNYYGTSRAFIKEQLDQGKSVLLDIDVQGAKQVMDSDLPLVSIFIMAPSLEELESRLTGRGTDTRQVIEKRLENAKAEIAFKSAYDHVVVNDDLDTATNQLCAIFANALSKEQSHGRA